ncbi:MAG: MATE family efflux transporter [Lachnospiraceae bacterium]|nr:MATE family efflux transporter [Lachnospiraceae bacterium]
MKLYDKNKIDWNNILFDNKALFLLLVPIVVEQLLNSFMGMVDTTMVSTVGSEAISAVSLVDSFNNLIIQVFSAMAAGAAIICSQYLGSGDTRQSNKAARQVVLTVTVISVGVMLICLIGRERLLRLIFGEVEEQVMSGCLVYFLITVISYPFLALFSVGAAFFRAGGNSRFPMKVSVISNVLNIAGNAIFIYGFQWSVAGAALATLISRVFCTAVIFYYLRKPRQVIVVRDYFRIRPDMPLIWKIMAIGIPSGIENGMFQFGKLAIQSTVSTMGTVAIAAQAMANILETLNGVFGIGIGIGLMTVVGQCIGAGRKEEAKYYIVKLSGVAWVGILVSCLFVFAITKPVTWIAGMEPEAAQMCFEMLTAITIVKPLVWVGSFVISYGLRAAGDVRFSMIVSTVTMWCCRVVLCIYLVRVYHFGPMAVWIGMFADWTVRAIIFSARFLGGKWIKSPKYG